MKKSRAVIDQAAAQMILQTYLDAEAFWVIRSAPETWRDAPRQGRVA